MSAVCNQGKGSCVLAVSAEASESREPRNDTSVSHRPDSTHSENGNYERLNYDEDNNTLSRLNGMESRVYEMLNSNKDSQNSAVLNHDDRGEESESNNGESTLGATKNAIKSQSAVPNSIGPQSDHEGDTTNKNLETSNRGEYVPMQNIDSETKAVAGNDSNGTEQVARGDATSNTGPVSVTFDERNCRRNSHGEKLGNDSSDSTSTKRKSTMNPNCVAHGNGIVKNARMAPGSKPAVNRNNGHDSQLFSNSVPTSELDPSNTGIPIHDPGNGGNTDTAGHQQLGQSQSHRPAQLTTMDGNQSIVTRNGRSGRSRTTRSTGHNTAVSDISTGSDSIDREYRARYRAEGEAEITEPTNRQVPAIVCTVANDSDLSSATTDNDHRARCRADEEAEITQQGPAMVCTVANGSGLSNASTFGSSSGSSASLPCAPHRPVFLDARTFEALQNLPGPRVHYSLNSSTVMCEGKTLKALLDELRCTKQEKERSAICQTILVRRLPGLADSGNFRQVASVLPVVQGNLQSAAGLALLRMLLALQHREEASLTEDLMAVLEVTQRTLLEQDDDNPALFMLSCLHLMTSSALLTRCPKPTSENCKQCLISSEECKRYAKESAKRCVLRVLQLFFEGFKGQLERPSSFRVWSNEDWTDKARQARKEMFQQSSFCDVVVFAFTLLNEISQHGWGPAGRTLILGLQDLNDAVLMDDKSKHCDEALYLVRLMVLRGAVVLLNYTFNSEKVNCDHITCLTELAVNLAQDKKKKRRSDNNTKTTLSDDRTKKKKSEEEARKRMVLNEVSSLPFHSVKEVRQKFNLLLRTNECRLHDLIVGNLEHCLQSVAFCRNTPASNPSALTQTPAALDDCSWNVVSATVCGKPVELSIYVPRAACMASESLDKCMNEHPGTREADVARSLKLSETACGHKSNFKNLNKLSPKSKHVIQLLALQFDPVVFYVTESVEGQCLLLKVLEQRYKRSWLGVHTLLAVARDVLQIVKFLESEDMVSRDLTAHNMVIYRRADSTQAKENVFTGDFIVKLADLSLTHQYKEQGNDNIRPVRFPGAIPIRWACCEALRSGQWEPASMVFSYGCVLYELLTHGVQPFTSYDTTNTEEFDTKKFLNPSSVKLNQWACIPDSLNALIQHCTDSQPAKRPSTSDIENRLEDISKETFPNVTSEMDLDRILSWDKQFPEPCQDQVKRKHVPKKGIPEPVKQLMNAGKDSSLYCNTRKSNWFTTNHVAVTPAEFYAPDSIDIQLQPDRTVVSEKLTFKFVNEDMASLEAAHISRVTCWWNTENPVPVDGYFMHKREYPAGKDLRTAAAMGELSGVVEDVVEDLVYDTPEDPPTLHLRIFLAMARALLELHENGLLLRSLRASHVLLTEEKVILVRIGRVCKMAAEHCCSPAFEDMWRWLAPEVLVSNTYGRENDVFMLVTVFWETLRIMELSARDPAATDPHFAPFADILKSQVVHAAREGTPLPQPEGCEDWLYFDVILKGRNPEPSQRPAVGDIINTLLHYLPDQNHEGPFFVAWQRPQDRLASDSTECKVPPQLPLRKGRQITGDLPHSRIPIRASQRRNNAHVHNVDHASSPTATRPRSEHEKTARKLPATPHNRNAYAALGPAHPRQHAVYHHLGQHRHDTPSAPERPELPKRNAVKNAQLGRRKLSSPDTAPKAAQRGRGQENGEKRHCRSDPVEAGETGESESDGYSSVGSRTPNSPDADEVFGFGSFAGDDKPPPESKSRGVEPAQLQEGDQQTTTAKTFFLSPPGRSTETVYLPPTEKHMSAFSQAKSGKHKGPSSQTATESAPCPASSSTEPREQEEAGHPADDDSLLDSLPSLSSDSSSNYNHLGHRQGLQTNHQDDITTERETRTIPPATGGAGHINEHKDTSTPEGKAFVADSSHACHGYVVSPGDAGWLKNTRSSCGTSGQVSRAVLGHEVNHSDFGGLFEEVTRKNEVYQSDSASSMEACTSESKPTLHPSQNSDQRSTVDDLCQTTRAAHLRRDQDKSIYLTPTPGVGETCSASWKLAFGVQSGDRVRTPCWERGGLGSRESLTRSARAAGAGLIDVTEGGGDNTPGSVADQTSQGSACEKQVANESQPVSDASTFGRTETRKNLRGGDLSRTTMGSEHQPTSSIHPARTSRIPRRVSAPTSEATQKVSVHKGIPGVNIGQKTKVHVRPKKKPSQNDSVDNPRNVPHRRATAPQRRSYLPQQTENFQPLELQNHPQTAAQCRLRFSNGDGENGASSIPAEQTFNCIGTSVVSYC